MIIYASLLFSVIVISTIKDLVQAQNGIEVSASFLAFFAILPIYGRVFGWF